MAHFIKTEQDIPIKPDPEDHTPAPIVDDFDYEDTGELEIPREHIQAWLLRLPKQLYDGWAQIPDDQVVQLGHVRQLKGVNNNKWQLHLNPTLPQSQGVVKRYDMRSTGQAVRNTYVFSEKDLPGFKSKGKTKGHAPGGQNGHAGSSRDKVDKGFRYQSWSRKAIPKQTRLAASINKEVTCIPLDVQVENRQQRLDAVQGKGGMTILKGDVRKFAGMFVEPEAEGAVKSRTNFDNFKTDTAPTKAKGQENKTARMPQNELLDKLDHCFTKYQYWSMTALRQTLHQPESYLRQTLMLLADQVKSGPFNNSWKLKPENEKNHLERATREEIAPTRDGDGGDEADGATSGGDTGMGEDDEDDDDDNDDDLQMEDVGL